MGAADKKLSFTGMAIALLEDGTEASMDAVLGVIACAEECSYRAERYTFNGRAASDDLVEADLALRCAVDNLVDRYEKISRDG